MLCAHNPIFCWPRLAWLRRTCPNSTDRRMLCKHRGTMSSRIDEATSGWRTKSAKFTQATSRRISSGFEREVDDQVSFSGFSNASAALRSLPFPKLLMRRTGSSTIDDLQKPRIPSATFSQSDFSSRTLDSRSKMRSSIFADNPDLDGTCELNDESGLIE